MRSVLFATGVDAETNLSAFVDLIVMKTAAFATLPTVSRAHASLISN
jgi:hypothetical protein